MRAIQEVTDFQEESGWPGPGYAFGFAAASIALLGTP
jgi:hypothetical protein